MSDQNLTDWRKLGLKLEAEINKVILGQELPIRLVTNAIFATRACSTRGGCWCWKDDIT